MKEIEVIGIIILTLFIIIGTTTVSADLILMDTFCIGGSGNDYGYSVQQTTDGGFVLAGYTTSSDGNFTDAGYHGGQDAFIAKINSSCSTVDWVRCIGGSRREFGYSVQQTVDGGFILAGFTASSDGDFIDSGFHGADDAYVAKLNGTGAIEWIRCIGGSGYDHGHSVQQTTDGGFILGGCAGSPDGNFSDSNYHGDTDAFLTKFNETGVVIWTRCIGGSGGEYGYSVQQTSDEGFILAGSTTLSNGDFTGAIPGAFLAKVNATDHTVEWVRCLGGSGGEYSFSVHQTTDGSFILGGSTTSSDGDFAGTGYKGSFDDFIARINSTGTKEWVRCIGSAGNDQELSVIQATDGKFIVAGYADSGTGDFTTAGYHGGRDAFLANITNAGTIEYVLCIGGSESDLGHSIVQTTDGGLVLAGETTSIDGDFANTDYHGLSDAFLVKLINPLPAIDIEKNVSVDGGTTWEDSDTAPGPSVLVDEPIQWEYIITNIGNVPLTEINVTDNRGVSVIMPKTTLNPGESMIGTATGNAIVGQYTNIGTVTGYYEGLNVSDTDAANYFGTLPPPIANFTVNRTSGIAPLTLQFTDLSTGSPTNWAWDFQNDGITDSTSQNPTFTFASGGNYTVKLNVTAPGGSDEEIKLSYIIVTPPEPGIIIVSPKDGEIWQQGSDHILQWTFTGNPGSTVIIDVFKGKILLATLPGIPVGSDGTGSYNLKIPCSMPLGNYMIRVASNNNPEYNDTVSFTIGSAITVLSPEGGENWQQGSRQSINWNYTCYPHSMVKIEALRGTAVIATIPSVPIGSGGTGLFNLTVPYNTPIGTGYRIRITSTSYPACTVTSDDNFNISSALTIIEPNGGEKWERSSDQTIRWNYNGYPGASVKIEALRGTAVIATIPSVPIGSGGTGLFNLTVPSYTPDGTNYWIRITSTSCADSFDMSDGPFAISPPG